jgi:hypothetical protein
MPLFFDVSDHNTQEINVVNKKRKIFSHKNKHFLTNFLILQ